MEIFILLGTMIVCFLIGMPIAYSLAMAAIAGAFAIDIPLEALMLKISDGVSKVAMLTIPFFVLAGAIMAEGGMARRLVAFADVLVGFTRVRGGLSDEQCRRIRSYIRDRLQQELSLIELSSLVGLRPRQFSTLFRRAFGTTAHRYIVTQRVSEAARMLRSGEDNLAAIALRIGFCSQSHFTAAFRNAFGVTPGRYAAEWRKATPPS